VTAEKRKGVAGNGVIESVIVLHVYGFIDFQHVASGTNKHTHTHKPDISGQGNKILADGASTSCSRGVQILGRQNKEKYDVGGLSVYDTMGERVGVFT
jgi:hypothetical protein